MIEIMNTQNVREGSGVGPSIHIAALEVVAWPRHFVPAVVIVI